ncbi:MAG TPA: hypothetical protein VH062_01730 [Polyangiaceae bacterium]|nr:hypothetical protein [Polyangiaceae bacterium]
MPRITSVMCTRLTTFAWVPVPWNRSARLACARVRDSTWTKLPYTSSTLHAVQPPPSRTTSSSDAPRTTMGASAVPLASMRNWPA